MSELPDPNMDGIDHINVYSRGRTRLGVMLSNWTHAPFTHPVDGRFNSVEGYWYWLKMPRGSQREQLRGLSGYDAKRRGRELCGDHIAFPKHLRIRIKEAIRLKVYAVPELMKLMLANSLPYKHYYVYGGAVREGAEQWVTDFIEELAEELKEGQ